MEWCDIKDSDNDGEYYDCSFDCFFETNYTDKYTVRSMIVFKLRYDKCIMNIIHRWSGN